MESRTMADELNVYFASVFTIKDTSNIPEIAVNQEMEGREELRKITITGEVVLSKLLGVRADKSWVLMDFMRRT